MILHRPCIDLNAKCGKNGRNEIRDEIGERQGRKEERKRSMHGYNNVFIRLILYER